jgi:hypothetical protein
MEATRTNMSTLKALVEKKLDQIDWDLNNLEKGQIYSFSPATEYTKFLTGFCWIACSTGKVILDVWGAGGSGARMCCCGGGLPGNPGAWSRKCICVVAGCFICGDIGTSCNNASALCFRGCSEATQVCWFGVNRNGGAAVNGCICAEGGRGGTTFCNPSGTLICCFIASNFCATLTGAGCGIVCNYGSGTAQCCAASYGGDINKYGGFSCTTMDTCYSNCPCSTKYHLAIPPGMFACDGGVVTYMTEGDNGFSEWSGMGVFQSIHTINVASRSPARGIMWQQCWNSTRSCGCYDTQGCFPLMPPAFGGVPAQPCGDVRDNGTKGGQGLVRITFISRT